MNRKFSELWPNITQQKPQMPDADELRDTPGKFETHFSEAPGTGD
jgi:ferredoxin